MELSSRFWSLEILNDASMLLSQILIGGLWLSQEYL